MFEWRGGGITEIKSMYVSEDGEVQVRVLDISEHDRIPERRTVTVDDIVSAVEEGRLQPV